MTQETSKMIQLGFVSRPHGIKGEAELFLHNPEDSILENGMKVFLLPEKESSQIPKEGEWREIKSIRFGNKIVVVFDNIIDRTHLETLIPFSVSVARSSFPKLPEGEHYLQDLIGLECETTDGKHFGVIDSFAHNGAQLLAVVRTKSGNAFELPYVKVFFPEVKLAENKIIIVPPEYTE